MERLLKGVDKKDWHRFKVEAIKHNMRMGDFLSVLLEEHVEREEERDAWKIVEEGKASITSKEAEKVLKSISVFEKDYNFE